MRLVTDFYRDAVLGVRLLARAPGFSAVSMATLAIAIGGNASVFSIINALLLTPPPVAEPARLARVDTGQNLTSWPNYEDIRDRTDIFNGVAAYRLTSMRLGAGSASVRLRGQVTSSNYLTVLGVPPDQGRIYTAADMAVDGVVIAHHVWGQNLGADPDAVGRTVTLGGKSFRLLGVMPQGFRGITPPGVRLDFWLPVDASTRPASLSNRLLTQFDVVGRLRPGLSHEAATAALRPLAARLEREHPELPDTLSAIRADAIGGVLAFRGMASLLLPVFGFLALLTLVSGFVLVIGCSNIAGLLIGRGAARQREIAVRLSLGASRGRLLRQLLTESLVLAFAGGVAGLGLAMGILAAARSGVARLPTPLDLTFTLDQRVLVYVLVLATGTALFFGLLPARAALRLNLISSLKVDSSGSPTRQRLRRLMVTAQVAICAALVVWSALFLRSLGNIHSIEPGFDTTNIVMATVELDRGAFPAEQGAQILAEWTRRVTAAPGVESAAVATIVPLALTGREEFNVSTADEIGAKRRVVANRVTPGWFAMVRVPLVRGRDFTWNDRRGSFGVAIVNETLARQFWNGDALGRRLMFGTASLEVIGVAKDSKYRTLGEITPPLIYLPLYQQYAHFVTMHARTSDPRGAEIVMRQELERLAPGSEPTVESMTDAVAVAVLPARIGATATSVFGMIGVCLAAFGVYGLVSFSVIQRRREIGIRRAIGAATSDIVTLIVGHHAILIAAGLAIGGSVGVLGAIVMRAFLAGVGPTDPLALFAACAVVGGSALAASALPAVRATRIPPIAALRDM